MHEQNAEYVTNEPMTEVDVLNKASEILETKFLKGEGFTSPSAAKDFLRYKLAHQKREVFAILLMDSQHRLIEYKELFFGTINAAPVYPREVMKEVLQQNAAAVILAHNHPSGVTEPSEADKRVTTRIKDALNHIDVPVLDHIVVGQDTVSFAERGLL
jgi:DNA repair protein RadC